MEFFLNYILAWITVFIIIFLSLKYIIKKIASGNGKYKEFFKKLNKSSRKSHIFLGILACFTGLIHGIFSGENILSFNTGTLLLIVIILLGMSYAIRKLFRNKKTWLIIHRFLTVVTLGLIVIHILDFGGINVFNELNYILSSSNKTENTIVVQSEKTTSTPEVSINETTVEPEIATSTPENNTLEEYNSNLFGVVLKDGTYTGVADAYGSNLTVSVEISNNNVTNISIVSHNEKNSNIYSKAMQQVPTSIIDAQSLDVDTVSGATFTSVGIINAVNEALSQAVVSGQLPQMLSLPTNRGH